jgi:integrase/recombinase XerD
MPRLPTENSHLRKPPPLPRLLSRHQVKCLMAAVNLDTKVGYRDRAILECMYRAGMRCCEIGGLRVEDVWLEDGYLEIRNTKWGSSRVVPVSPALAGWLWLWRDRRPTVYPDCPWFFMTLGRVGWNGGHQLETKRLWSTMQRYKRLAGIEGKCSPHMLRHTFATELLEDSFTIKDVQDLLGHRSLATTQVYLHSRPEELRKKMLARAMG